MLEEKDYSYRKVRSCLQETREIENINKKYDAKMDLLNLTNLV